MIAGEGIVGILLAVFAIIEIGDKSLGEWLDLSGSLNLGNWGGLLVFALLSATLVKVIVGKKKIK